MRTSVLRWELAAGTVALSWLLMQAAHELGHVVHALLTGGRVQQVVLHPLQISRTDVSPNPSPGWVVWGGPLWGVLLPLAAWLIVPGRRLPGLSAFLRFLAGFCLIANGAYIGAGAFVPVGDAAVMLDLGVPRWALVAFGALTVPAGLLVWHRSGPMFGWGPGAVPVNPLRAHLTTGAVLLAVLIMLLFF